MNAGGIEIRRMDDGDTAAVLAAGHLFDNEPTEQLTARFLERDGHHLLIGFVGSEAVGFVTGIEIDHPDKATEMLLYELGVDGAHRRQGHGTALCGALVDLARRRGCRSMWVPIDADDPVAGATYRAAGAAAPVPGATLEWDLTSR